MTQPPFLFRALDGGLISPQRYRIFQAGEGVREKLLVHFKPILKRFGFEQRDTYQRDRSKLYLTRVGATQHTAEVPATAAGLKGALRRLRDQEAAELDAIDGRIAEHYAAIKVLNEQRRAKLSEAWQKANVVRLQDVLPEAEAEAREAAQRLAESAPQQDHADDA